MWLVTWRILSPLSPVIVHDSPLMLLWSFTDSELRLPNAVEVIVDFFKYHIVITEYSTENCFNKIMCYLGPYCIKVRNQSSMFNIKICTNLHWLLWVMEFKILIHAVMYNIKTSHFVLGKLPLTTIVVKEGTRVWESLQINTVLIYWEQSFTEN